MRYWLDNFSTGYINPLTGLPDITSSESSLIVSILSAGTFFGALFAAPLGDFIGRRIALMITILVFCFGVIFKLPRPQFHSSLPDVSLLALALG